MDAGLAKVMNSSVGTSTLKALDAILKTDNTAIANNAADKLYNLFKSNVKLVGSDNVMFSYSGTWANRQYDTSIGTLYCTSNLITFDTSGTVRFMLPIKRGSAASMYMYIFDESDVVVGKLTAIDVKADTPIIATLDVNVSTGKKYRLGVGGASFNPSGLYIGATTILFGATATLTS